MYLVEVVPLTKIPLQKPQILSYFSINQLNEGFLVSVPLGRRQEKAIVIEIHQIKDFKLEIKKAEYELRPVKRILNAEPVLATQQIKLALWLGNYYFTSPGLFMKMMMPRKVQISKFKVQSYNSKFKINKHQKLILVPEILKIDSLKNKFPKEKTAIIHSGLSAKQLNENWQKIARGETEIIIGTRLASFVPFFNLKEITIMDETNSSHRSWDMFPHYRTHEIAKKLAELFGAKITLKSDIPSVESFYFNSQKLLNLKIDSKKSKNTPEIELVDLRQEMKDGNYSIFSRKLQARINSVLEKNQQIILFINRRGLATFVLCRDCGYVAKCPNCDAPLTYHLTRSKPDELKPLLICHHCGQKLAPPSLCPKCNGYRIKIFGTGTQRVEIEAKKIFKNAKILRLDSDVAQTSAQENTIIQNFRQKKADILIGTQMILNSANWRTKVPLAAIISADTLLHLPDFQSDEKTLQTINQVKNFTNSQLLIQTYNPQTQILQIALKGELKYFYDKEIETRQALKYPPFSQLIKLVFGHRDPKKAAEQAEILYIKLTQQLKNSKILKEAVFEISEPLPAFIAKERSRYIWQIILKIKPFWLASKSERQDLLTLRNKFLLTVPPFWKIEVDPETLL